MGRKFGLHFVVLAWVALFGVPHIKAAAQIPDVVVAADGSGDFTSVQEAVMSIRDYKPVRTTILIRKGVYREKVVIPANKCDITLIGEQVDSTIITWNDHARINQMGTFKSYTLLVQGSGIYMESITIENNAEPVAQAVALHVEGDRCMWTNCRLLGNQDTLFTGNGLSRQYFKNCYIEGTTDFIFGPATVWFEQCILHSKRNSYITAASTPRENAFGYVFHRCQLTAADGVDRVFLGRPWRAFASVLFMECEMGKHIVPDGWDNWQNAENERTARYSEYHNSGPGAKTALRVSWSRVLTPEEALAISPQRVFQHESLWTP